MSNQNQIDTLSKDDIQQKQKNLIIEKIKSEDLENIPLYIIEFAKLRNIDKLDNKNDDQAQDNVSNNIYANKNHKGGRFQKNQQKDSVNLDVKSTISFMSTILIEIIEQQHYENDYIQIEQLFNLQFKFLELQIKDKNLTRQKHGFKVLICDSIIKIKNSTKKSDLIKNQIKSQLNQYQFSIEQLDNIQPIKISKQFQVFDYQEQSMNLDILTKFISKNKNNKDKLIFEYCSNLKLINLIDDQQIIAQINKYTDDQSIITLKNFLIHYEDKNRLKNIVNILLQEKNYSKVGLDLIKDLNLSIQDFPKAVNQSYTSAIYHYQNQCKKNELDKQKLYDLFSQNKYSIQSLLKFLYKNNKSMFNTILFFQIQEFKLGILNLDPDTLDENCSSLIESSKLLSLTNDKLIEKYSSDETRRIIEIYNNQSSLVPQSNGAFHLNFEKQNLNYLFVDSVDKYEYMKKCFDDSSIVGFDSEWATNQISGKETNVDIIQLSNGKFNFILDMSKIDNEISSKKDSLYQLNWSYVASLFENPGKIIIGYGLKSDIKLLKKAFDTLEPKPKLDFIKNKDHIVDLEHLTKDSLHLNYKNGLSGLCALFDLSICKYEQLGNWSRRPLRSTQLHQAYTDAFICIFIQYELKLLYSDLYFENNMQNQLTEIRNKIRIDQPISNQSNLSQNNIKFNDTNADHSNLTKSPISQSTHNSIETYDNLNIKSESTIISDQQLIKENIQSICMLKTQIENKKTEYRFLCDKASEKVGKLLRGIGFDCEIMSENSKNYCMNAVLEDRVIICRSKKIWESAKYNANIIYFLSKINPEDTVKSLIKIFKISQELQNDKFCSRCIACNSTDVKKVDKEIAKLNNVPQKSLDSFSIFQICQCGKNQWVGNKFKDQNENQKSLFDARDE